MLHLASCRVATLANLQPITAYRPIDGISPLTERAFDHCRHHGRGADHFLSTFSYYRSSNRGLTLAVWPADKVRRSSSSSATTCAAPTIPRTHRKQKGEKGTDVDLYSTSHVQDTSNAHFVTETEPPGRF